MADHNPVGPDQGDLVDNVPEAESPDVTNGQPGGSSSSKGSAERTRQQISREILDATRDVYKRLISSGEQSMRQARALQAKAERKLLEAQQELERAQAIRASGEAMREQLIANAQEQAKEILKQARAAAQHESFDVRHKAAWEAKQALAQAAAIKAAALEELEANKIYLEATKLEAESREVLAMSLERLDQVDAPAGGTEEGPSAEVQPAAKKDPFAGDQVIGVEIGDGSKAYPIKELVDAQVVNDTLRAHDILVVLDSASGDNGVFSRNVNGRSLSFAPLPEREYDSMMMEDSETGTVWHGSTGIAMRGPLLGWSLQKLPSIVEESNAWFKEHADSRVYQNH